MIVDVQGLFLSRILARSPLTARPEAVNPARPEERLE
jgi:hypothetical protein